MGPDMSESPWQPILQPPPPLHAQTHTHTYTLSVPVAPCRGWALGVVCIQAQIKSEAGLLLSLPFTHAEMQTWLSFYTFTLSIPPSSPPSCHSVCLAQPFIRSPATITTKKIVFLALSFSCNSGLSACSQKDHLSLFNVCLLCLCAHLHVFRCVH